MINITSASFKEVITTNGMVLIDVWAPWCGPCKRMDQELEIVASNPSAAKLTIAKVDADEEFDLAAELGVKAVPSFFLYKDGQKIDFWTGFCTAGSIVARLDKLA